MPISDAEIKKVLVVTAHPDDLDFMMGGTLKLWSMKGIELHYLICTNGDQGGFDPNIARADMPQIRQREQRAAGEVLGATSIEFLNYVDGHLTPTLELRKKIVAHIRKIQPDRMAIQSPERNWDRIGASHPDHLAAGEAAIQAVYPDARNEFAFMDLLEQGLQPWKVREVWVASHPTPDHFVDITTTIEDKIKAIKAHASQLPDLRALDERIHEWSAMIAKANGLPAGSYAEQFKIVNTD
jgi:LmbE family N-acetylglucosaminyl deacetylase